MASFKRALLVAFILLSMFIPSRVSAQAMLRAEKAQLFSSMGASSIPLTYDPKAGEKTQTRKKLNPSRALIVALGSLPFTAFYTDFVFDSVRYVSNGFDAKYTPWPFKNQYSAEIGVTERFIRLGVSLGVSAIIGILDILVPTEN